MKNAKHFIGTLKHNKIFKRVLSVILSLTMLIGVVQLIVAALPEPETQADLDVSFAVTSYKMHFEHRYQLGPRIDGDFSFDQGSLDLSVSGQATATANANYKFAYWTKGDGENAAIYSYSPTIKPDEDGTYYAWFSNDVIYVNQSFWRDDPKGLDYSWSCAGGMEVVRDPGGGAELRGASAGPAVFGAACNVGGSGNNAVYTAIVLEPTLLETAIQGTDYELVNFPVTLFDYDMDAFNAEHPFTNGNYETLHFWNGNQADNYGEGFTNYGDSYPKGSGDTQAAAQGIWENELDENGLPVPNADLGGNNTNLFEPVNSAGKTVYNDVGFQFVKDSSGWYTYDSALNHAQYDSGSNEVRLYYESLGIGSTGDKVAGFLPFDTFSGAYYSGGSAYPQAFSDWESKLTSSLRQTGVYALDNVNYHNGVVMEYSFYLPENGTVDGTPDGEPIQFEFNGDDDMWVFVDGELVLDIGGGHGAIAGTINFQEGTTWVERAVQSRSDTPTASNGTFTCEEDQYHEIKIFYLERFAGESNCRIRFNLPAVPQKSINVEKQVAAETEGVTLPQSVNDDEFTFALLIKNYGGDNYTLAANAEYSVVKTANPTVVTETGVTDENGCFKINAGERAIFEGYDSTDMFVVTEILSDSLSKKYSLVYIDDILATMQQYSSMPKQVTNKGNRVVFTNILTDPLVDAQLTKTAEAIEDNQYKITLSIANANTETPITVSDTVSRYFDIVSAQDSNSQGAVSGQTVTFTTVTDADGSWSGEIIVKPKAEFWGGNGVPTNDGAYATSAAEIEHSFSDSPTVDVTLNFPTLTGHDKTIYLGETAPTFSELFTGQDAFVVPTDESDPNYWKTAFVNVSQVTYSPDSVDATKSVTYTASVTVTPKNEGTVQATTVTAKAVLTVKTCTLTITKSGGADSGNYIFKLSGSGNNLAAAVNTVVSVGNNGTVTVKGLPIGTYTVTEDSGWSWRYNADDETAELSPASDTASVTVVNEKVNGNWLDSEAAVTNDFNN